MAHPRIFLQSTPHPYILVPPVWEKAAIAVHFYGAHITKTFQPNRGVCIMKSYSCGQVILRRRNLP